MGRKQRDALVHQILENLECLGELLELVKKGTQVQRMKGAWVLSGVHSSNKALLAVHRMDFLKQLTTESIGGVKRELLRCFEDAEMDTEVRDALIDVTMRFITDEKQDFAVRYICMKLLNVHLRDFPELQRELENEIELFKAKTGRFP